MSEVSESKVTVNDVVEKEITKANGAAALFGIIFGELLSIAMIVISVFQKTGDSDGMSALSGRSETFYNRNKGTTLQGKMKVATIVIAVLILVLCIVFLILNKIFQGWI